MSRLVYKSHAMFTLKKKKNKAALSLSSESGAKDRGELVRGLCRPHAARVTLSIGLGLTARLYRFDVLMKSSHFVLGLNESESHELVKKHLQCFFFLQFLYLHA